MRGHRLYKAWRSAAPADRAAIHQKSVDYWRSVDLPSAWSELSGGSPKATSSSANVSLASPGSTGRPSQSTSAALTESQPRLGESTNARTQETTANRLSQSNHSVSGEGAI